MAVTSRSRLEPFAICWRCGKGKPNTETAMNQREMRQSVPRAITQHQVWCNRGMPWRLVPLQDPSIPKIQRFQTYDAIRAMSLLTFKTLLLLLRRAPNRHYPSHSRRRNSWSTICFHLAVPDAEHPEHSKQKFTEKHPRFTIFRYRVGHGQLRSHF